MNSQLAMARIKTRVSPTIPPNQMPMTPVNFTVKVRIDEDGNVEVKNVLQGKSPVDHKLKFHPQRNPMPIIDAPLTVVSGNGSVTLDDKQAVKDALVCQGCAK